MLGEIYAIPLANGDFAFARCFLKNKYGVFDFTSKKIESPILILRHTIAFWVSCYEEPTKTGQWPYVGRVPFASICDAWPPAIYFRDLKDPRFCTMIIRNESWSVRPEDLEGLEPVQLWSVEMICDRIKHQIIERKPWDIKAHCLYHQDLKALYGPDYEEVIANKFRDVPWRKSHALPGTMIDSVRLDHYLKQPLGISLFIDFVTENAFSQMGEIEKCLNELLTEKDVGGVVGSKLAADHTDSHALGSLQLRVFHRSNSIKVIKTLLKQKLLNDEVVLSFRDD